MITSIFVSFAGLVMLAVFHVGMGLKKKKKLLGKSPSMFSQ